MKHTPVPIEQLYKTCDPDLFDFDTTDSISAERESIGQERALDAIKFSINIQKAGYNLYVMAPTGAGKHTLVREVLKESQARKRTIFDWCYVNNFQRTYEPISIQLPAGMGKKLKRDLEEFTETLSHVLPKAFEAESYDKQVVAITRASQAKEEEAFSQLERDAKQKNIALLQTESEFSFAPLENGNVISPEHYDQLDESVKNTIQEVISELQHQLQGILQHIPKWQQESRKKIKSLNIKIAKNSVSYWVNDLKREYKSQRDVISYLQTVEDDVIENVENFLPQHSLENPTDANRPDLNTFLTRYHVNLLVDHPKDAPAPIIYESNPTLENLIGKIDSISQFGALVTDFSLIKAGALHKANNGYLVVDAFKLLSQPFAWDALKRALSSKEIIVEASQSALASTITLNPAPIPLNVKIILLGDTHLYFTLCEQDLEFNNLFKVIADLEDSIPRTTQTTQDFAILVATIARSQSLKALDKQAVARVIEHSSRLIENGEKLSTHNGEIRDLLTEADYWASQSNHPVITHADVQTAITQTLHRHARMQTEMQESIIKGNTLIATEGKVVGQINGLTVASLGNFTFGQPSRITALARMGDGKIIDIESEANLSGDIHTKGVLILSSFFNSRYALSKTLSFTASVVFEQSYGEIDGDSASAAELIAIMSAISNVPLKQSIAVTGAINQHGIIQAVGGINEKIEGFFDICSQRGLTGEHGVIVPVTNIAQLMLKSEIINAVKNGKFTIFAVDNIDDMAEILSDLNAGERDKKSEFPKESFNGKVESKLLKFAEISHQEDEHHEEHKS